MILSNCALQEMCCDKNKCSENEITDERAISQTYTEAEAQKQI